MQAVIGGQYTAQLVVSRRDLETALALRSIVFREGRDDQDRFDQACDHLVVKDVSGAVVACVRLLFMTSGAAIADSYAAQFYSLKRLATFPDPMVELGRFCVRPGHSDAEVLRVIWGALAAYVDAHAVRLLFGCTSFAGATIAGREAALHHLAQDHAAPDQWMPETKSSKAVALADIVAGKGHRRTLQDIPPLLRTYLSMGAWISDHAVIDDDLDTLHVFTGLEVAKIPPARKRLLRALSGS